MYDIIKRMRECGLVVLKTTSLPVHDSTVQAGLPTEAFGSFGSSTTVVARYIEALGAEFGVEVRGMSMIGFGIEEGDKVLIKTQDTASSGDIVIVAIDNAYTLKAYFEDEFGDKWLIPGNPKFQPIPINSEGCYLVGRVDQIQKKAPRATTRECMEAIRASECQKDVPRLQKQETHDLIVFTDQLLKRNKYTGSRPWFPLYRILVDYKALENHNFAGFQILLNDELDEEAPRLSIKDLKQNLDVLSFAKKFEDWKVTNAPVSVAKAKNYIALAQQILDELKRLRKSSGS